MSTRKYPKPCFHIKYPEAKHIERARGGVGEGDSLEKITDSLFPGDSNPVAASLNGPVDKLRPFLLPGCYHPERQQEVTSGKRGL
jgi:hypothetical protein